MKKLLFLSFLFLFVIKGFSQTIYNTDSTKSYSVKNGSYVEDKTDGEVDAASININYGEHDIYSVGVRFGIKNTILDFGFGSNIKSMQNTNDYVYHIAVYKIGIGRRLSENFSVGIDGIYIEKWVQQSQVTKVQDNSTNIGLFLSYKLVDFVDLNFTTNSLTGNSVGVSFNLK